jgi:hypothetical protein
MRERLVELIQNAHDEQKYLTSDKSIQAIADYLIANGVVVTDKYVGGNNKLDFGVLTYGKEDREGH